MVNRRSFITSVAAVLVSLDVKDATLQVQVTYAGAGTVDAAHKLWVSVWDTPDFVKGSAGTPPLDLKPLTSKSGTVEFTGLDKSPVYVAMIFDPSGAWDAQSDPPSGTSLGLYSTEPGVPAPISLVSGKTTKIFATLDDSYKKP